MNQVNKRIRRIDPKIGHHWRAFLADDQGKFIGSKRISHTEAIRLKAKLAIFGKKISIKAEKTVLLCDVCGFVNKDIRISECAKCGNR